MKKLNFVFGAFLFSVLSILNVSCDNMSETANEVDDAQPTTPAEVTTRNGGTFQVMTLPVGHELYRGNQTAYIDVDALKNEPVKDRDWGNALYFFDGDIRNYFDTDHPFYIKVTLQEPLRVINTTYEGFTTDNIDMDYVLVQVEEIVGSAKPEGKPFLLWLGEMGYGFRYYENIEYEVAVIIPHVMLSDNLFSQELIATL